MEAREIIALDLGSRHTGMARASSVARLAEPLNSVATNNLDGEIANYLKNNRVEAVVVGLPRNLSGQDSQQTLWVRDWVKRAKNRFPVTFYWQDETLTSEDARKLQTSKIKNQTTDEHSLAAALILQDFLDAPETERQIC